MGCSVFYHFLLSIGVWHKCGLHTVFLLWILIGRHSVCVLFLTLFYLVMLSYIVFASMEVFAFSMINFLKNRYIIDCSSLFWYLFCRQASLGHFVNHADEFFRIVFIELGGIPSEPADLIFFIGFIFFFTTSKDRSTSLTFLCVGSPFYINGVFFLYHEFFIIIFHYFSVMNVNFKFSSVFFRRPLTF